MECRIKEKTHSYVFCVCVYFTAVHVLYFLYPMEKCEIYVVLTLTDTM